MTLFCAAVNCGQLSNPNNGSVSFTGIVFGSTATYTCDPGYGIVGYTAQVCQVDYKSPECQGMFNEDELLNLSVENLSHLPIGHA